MGHAMFSILESVAFDTGYAGSNGIEPQSWVNGNGTSYIYFGSGDFDGQGSGHDFSGTLYMPPTGFINNCDGGRSTPTATTASSKQSSVCRPTSERQGRMSASFASASRCRTGSVSRGARCWPPGPVMVAFSSLVLFLNLGTSRVMQ